MLILCRNVVDVLERGSGAFSHGQTYQGHPLACRAGFEVQRIIQEKRLVSNVRKQGHLLGQLLQERLGGHPSVGNIRGKGLFWGIEFVKSKATKRPFCPSLGVAMKIHELGTQSPQRKPYHLPLTASQECNLPTVSVCTQGPVAPTARTATTSSSRQHTPSLRTKSDKSSTSLSRLLPNFLHRLFRCSSKRMLTAAPP